MNNYSLAFSVSPLGPKRFQAILNKFPSLEDALHATQKEYQEIGIVGLTFKKFDEFRKKFDINDYEKTLQKAGVTFIGFTEPLYPKKLKELENPPIGLFCLGNVLLLKNKSCIAIVGTRKITEYGKSVTEQIAGDLSKNGMCIISGLALGVDGISHRVTLENRGATIAVLACGVDCCTPSENYSLYKRILDDNGLIVSEYPLSQPPNKGTFLARNRIVAALSDGVLVTEASSDSGSLVTAEWGLRLNKKVFAVPGPINSAMAQGSLMLLKQGAKLVTEAEDIFQALSIQKKVIRNTTVYKNLKSEEKKIIALLENEEMTVDELSKKLKVPVSQLFVTISNLELKGIIKNKGAIFALQNSGQK